MRRERAESFKCSMWRAHFYRKRVSMPPIAMCTSRFLWPRTRALPGVIVETLVDSEFCSARQNAQSQLAKHKFVLDSQHGGELPLALPVDVLGMAFEDFDHNRGSVQVQPIWELHPAIVTIP